MKMKKVWSVILSVAMLLSVIAGTVEETYATTPTDIVNVAKTFEGSKNYYRNGTNYCLQYVDDVYQKAGLTQTRYASATIAGNYRITNTDRNIPVGAQVFFTTDSGVGHVAIYLGYNQMIHADRETKTVHQSSITSWYWSRYRGWGWGSPAPQTTVTPSEPIGHVMSEAEAAGRTIPDGDYWIVSELDQNYFIDLPGDNYNLTSGENVAMHLWGTYNTPLEYDAFHFQYLNNGFYKISQRTTNLCLDSQGATLKRSNAELFTANNSNAQQWSVIPTERGFKLQARCNSFFLDVKGAAVENATNVQVWEGNESKAQYFGLIPYAPNERPIKDGIYTINSNGNKSLYLDVEGFPQNYVLSSNVHVWNNDDEKFKLEYAGDGYYRIYENVSGYAVEVENTVDVFLKARQNVKLYSKNNSRGQFWKIRKNSNGTFTFINKLSGYCLDLKGGASGAKAGTNIHQWYPNGSDAQIWNINIPVAKPAKPVVSVSSKNKTVTVSWTKAPVVNKYDKRTYSINIYQKTKSGVLNLVTNKTVESKSGLTDTKYTFNAPDYGDYYVKVTAVNTNYDNYKTASAETAFTVKKENPIVAKGKTATVKYAKVKKKNQTIALKNAMTVSKAQGKVTFKKASGNKKITVASNGKITVKKGLKKGTYKVKVTVRAAGNAAYKAATKTVTVTIKVK